jgi:DNA-binding transcriptional regulator YiaG
MSGEIDRPVDVAHLLVEHGTSLRRAHAFLQRIARGEAVAVELRTDDPGAVASSFARLGIEALELRIPEVSTRDIRARLNLSQGDFAMKFGFELDTVQNWDQGRNQPDTATRVLLAIIDRDPAIVESVLTERHGTSERT